MKEREKEERILVSHFLFFVIIFFSLILPNLAFTEILEKFPLACICDKSINALKYFDCKQKVSGTQLDIIENKKNKNVMIFSSFDEKKYQLFDEDNLSLIFNYDTEDYISSISIKDIAVLFKNVWSNLMFIKKSIFANLKISNFSLNGVNLK